MTEPKFTPGPWHVEFSMCEDMTFAVIVNENRKKCIAEVFLNDNEDEQEANAHLVAAAPEMYELLSEILEFEPRGINLNFFDRINPKIDAVLRKARGESEVNE